jgi:hypothetical protein
VYYVGGEVLAPVHSPEGEPPKGVSPRVFPNLKRTSPDVNNSLSISSLLSRFVGKKYFHGNVGTYEIGELYRIMP